MKYLLDTNIIIYYLNNGKKAIKFIDTNLTKCAISTIIQEYEIKILW